jgi:copper(I)-binding protein
MRQPALPFALVISIAALMLSSCVVVGNTAGSVTSDGIAVSDPFSRAAPQMNGNGAAFMTITNNSAQADRLLSITSDVAEAVELHETIDDNGVMKMIPQPQGFELSARGRLELKPGGKHVMLVGLAAPLEAGKDFELTLNFEKAGPVKVTVPVREP